MANKSDHRAERLAAALRENLKRRKAKARQAPASPLRQPSPAPPPQDPKPQ